MDKEYDQIPTRTIDAINGYVNEGRSVGGFLWAVLSNDLQGAVGRADLENLDALVAIVRYVYNEIPADAWGSEEKVKQWIVTANVLKCAAREGRLNLKETENETTNQRTTEAAPQDRRD
jgi:hypothetical protein